MNDNITNNIKTKLSALSGYNSEFGVRDNLEMGSSEVTSRVKSIRQGEAGKENQSASMSSFGNFPNFSNFFKNY